MQPRSDLRRCSTRVIESCLQVLVLTIIGYVVLSADEPKSGTHINTFIKKLRMVHLFVRSWRCVPNSTNVSSHLILSGKLVGYTITDNVTLEQVSSAATPVTTLGLIPL